MSGTLLSLCISFPHALLADALLWLFHSPDVKFNENKESEIVSNKDPGTHLVVDFSSDQDSKSPTESKAPVDCDPQKVATENIDQREKTTKLLWNGANPLHGVPK